MKLDYALILAILIIGIIVVGGCESEGMPTKAPDTNIPSEKQEITKQPYHLLTCQYQ